MADPFPPSPFDPPKGRIPFSGIATFAGYPLWQAGTGADAVILGVPYDEGTTYRPGARLGPRAVRDASMFYAYEGQNERFYDTDRRKWILTDKVIADAGDVDISPLNLERNWQAITAAVQIILDAQALPAVIGGDHSITQAVLAGYEGRSFHYVHLDTHIDCDRIFESRFTHGSPVLHILEECRTDSISIIGARGLSNSGEDMVWAQEQGVTVITAGELRQRIRAGGFVPDREGDYYLSLDIDFFDPAAAPGTGTPEPGGLFFPDFVEVVRGIRNRGNIIGCDLVEVNPLLDGRGAITSHLAARCLLELLSAALD